MEKLTTENLEFMIRQVIVSFPGKIYDVLTIYGLATATLRHYLGDEWTNQNASAFFEQKILKRIGREGTSSEREILWLKSIFDMSYV